jgi:hypothetical protein
MKLKLVAAAAATVALAACAAAPVETEPVTPAQPAPPPADARALPSGTILDVRLQQELDAAATRVGDTFTVVVVDSLVARNGRTVVPAGSVITGLVTGVGLAGGDREVAAIRLNFVRINVEGISHPVTANIVAAQLPGSGEPLAEVTEPGAAVRGSILGGELRDRVAGAVLGAGAGTIISLGTGDADPVIPEGTRFTLQTVGTVQLR